MKKLHKTKKPRQILHSFSRGYLSAQEQRKSTHGKAHRIAEEALEKLPAHEIFEDVRGIDQ